MKHCLIVDNSAVIRKVARRILDGVGYYVSEASSGAEGWRLCRNTMPDFLLLDYILPDMGALEFIESLRRSNAAPLPHILLCTPFLDLPRIMKAKRAGAAGYVLKPFDRAQLLCLRTPARPTQKRRNFLKSDNKKPRIQPGFFIECLNQIKRFRGIRSLLARAEHSRDPRRSR